MKSLGDYAFGISIAALALGIVANVQVADKTSFKALRDASFSVTKSGKVNPYQWDDLEQAEVNALQRKLEAMPKMPVTIFCSDDNCRNIALDFDNAFESAKWTTEIERPMIDNSTGIWTSSREIADAIASVTNGRLKASILGPEWSDKTKIALAIGRKPR